MSCRCEHQRMGSDYERIAGLAKKYAVNMGVTVAIYKRKDGTYAFSEPGNEEIIKPIIEYKTPY